jgi:hypothetical protein
MITRDQIIKAQFEYWRIKPNSIPKRFINDYKTIIQSKQFLKSIDFSEKVLIIIVDIIIEKIRNKRRFRKDTTVSIVRNILRSKPQNISLKLSTVDKLFEIYQSLVLIANEEICWKLSSFLMDQKLNDEQVNWLINNSDRSVHVLNRLLRYPVKNETVSKWAVDCIDNKKHNDRISELIGKALDYNAEYKYSNKTQWTWGVYYSSLPIELKENLLVENLNQENFESVIEILLRYGSHKMIKKIITAANK